MRSQNTIAAMLISPLERVEAALHDVASDLVSRAGSWFTVRSCDDRVGVFGPDERVAALVPAVDECGDRLDQVVDGVEGAAADGLAGDDPEEDLDHVQPRPDVGVKCKAIRGLRASQALTAGCLWVA